MKVTDYIAQFLEERGVPCVFEMSGGMITHLLDSIHRRGATPIVSVHHEQSAAFAIDAVGRLTGTPGVAMATSGPGATNLLTGMGSCYFDSSPAIFITGQVNRNEQKGERAIRQLGFQETDIVTMAAPITKAAWPVNDPEQVPEMLQKAFDLAMHGRPGPVLLDIPMDVQNTDISVPEAAAACAVPRATSEKPLADGTFWRDLLAALQVSKRPLVLVGGGIRSAGVTDLLRNFVHRLGIPVVSSLMAVDVLPYDDPLRAGWHGPYGNRWTNMAIGTSDLLLVLGSRLDVRQTGADTNSFKGDRVVFHVDVEPGEMNNRVTGCTTLVSDLRPFLLNAVEASEGQTFVDRGAWVREIAELRDAWPDTTELAGVPGINPNVFMHQLSRRSSAAMAFVIDVGQHQMWAAQSLELGPEQRFLSSGGMGSMGFALPAALGAAIVAGGRPVVVIAGDGGFQSNIQELETVVRNKLPMKIVIINNGCHGMVRQFQESYFESRYQSTLWGYSAPDFTRVADAYGIRSNSVADPDGVEEALSWLWENPAEPALLQVMVDTYTNTYPKIAFGKPLTEMEPFFKPIAMEST